MSLSNRALEALNEHWAVAAMGADELERAANLVHQRLARRAVGRQISFSFPENADDEPFLERVALAFELAAIEGLDELSRPAGQNRHLRDQAVAAFVPGLRYPPAPSGSVGDAGSLVFCASTLRGRLLWRSLVGSAALVSGAGRGVQDAECRGCGMGPQAAVQAVRVLGPALPQGGVGRS